MKLRAIYRFIRRHRFCALTLLCSFNLSAALFRLLLIRPFSWPDLAVSALALLGLVLFFKRCSEPEQDLAAALTGFSSAIVGLIAGLANPVMFFSSFAGFRIGFRHWEKFMDELD